MTSAYDRLRAYCSDLSERLEAQEQWMKRHPDSDSLEYRNDEHMYYDENVFMKLPPQSSFDPNDPKPRTDDLFTSRLLCDLMKVALDAHDRI